MCPISDLLLVTAAEGMMCLQRVRTNVQDILLISAVLKSTVENVRSCFLLVALSDKPHTGFSDACNTYSGHGPWELQIDFKG